MARIRTVKPEFFLHEGLFDAESETGLPCRLAFAGLWCHADREGRFKWRPRALKAGILPFDDVDFSRVLDALTTRGFVVRYASEGGDFGYIPGFARHQVVNNRERESDLPDPDATTSHITTSTREPRVPHAYTTRGQSCKAEGKGKEGKGKEGNMEGKGRERNLAPPEAAGAVATYLLHAILEHSPDARQPKNLDAWAREIDLAMRLDRRTPDELRAAIDFAHRSPEGSFWRPNILSAKSLRDKFDRLKLQAMRAAEKNGSNVAAILERADELERQGQ